MKMLGNGFGAYVLRRFAKALVLIFFVLTLIFIIDNLIGIPKNLHWFDAQALRRFYGLDQPLDVRYIKFLYNMATFQFGDSLRTDKPIASDMVLFLSNTFMLLAVSSILSIVIGVGIGILSAYKAGGVLDSTSFMASATTLSLPTFWVGLLAISILSYDLGWFPPGGSQPEYWAYTGVPSNLVAVIQTRIHFAFLPVAVLTLFQYGLYVLLTRATTMQALTEDYITTARAKGLPERTVLAKHAWKNASLPLVTFVTLLFGSILGAVIMTEAVFRWPGLGLWTFVSIQFGDIPVLQVIFYLSALGIIIANFAAEIIHGLIDPRRE